MIKWQEPSPESDSLHTRVLRELKDKIAVIGNLWFKAVTGFETFFFRFSGLANKKSKRLEPSGTCREVAKDNVLGKSQCSFSWGKSNYC